MRTTIRLTPPTPFDFNNTACSHGWVALAPNAWDADGCVLHRTERLRSGQVVRLEVRGSGSIRKPGITVNANSPARLLKTEREEVSDSVSRMFRLDEDLTPFYRLCRKKGGHWKNVTAGFGRLLASPTVFEDVVKVICTTNIQWSGTTKMVESLVAAYGEPFAPAPSLHAFPTAGVIAAADPGEFAASVRLGYRARYVHLLAGQVATGASDLESLRDPQLPTAELKRRLLAIKGVGAYAAATLLMLLGHYDDLGVDTVARDFTAKKYFDGRKPAHQEVHALYEEWGDWRFLAYWFDLLDGSNTDP